MRASCLAGRWFIAALFISAILIVQPAASAAPTVKNLALSALGATARSWEPGVPVVPGHEPARINDGSLHSYWVLRSENLPADVGTEWPQPQRISSVIIRYFDGHAVRGPVMARTQQWSRLQYWDQEKWIDLKTEILGQETSAVRYTFPPITTTRLRVLFTELPDPEFRSAPDHAGISICEFEAYRDAPFQRVEPPVRLEPRRGPFSSYLNEWSGDNPYDRVRPLVVEPKQTRIFTDTLSPTLIVSETRWARTPVKVEEDSRRHIVLQNGFLQLELSAAGSVQETRLTNLVTGESVSTPRSEPFAIRTAQGERALTNFRVQSVNTSGSDAETGRVTVNLESDDLGVSIHYELHRLDHFYFKWLTVRNKRAAPIQVLDVTVSSLGLPRLLDLMAGPELTYPIERLEKGGFFECLQTMYWDHVGDALTYYPGATVPAGQALESEKAVVGVYRNAGEQVEGFDRGVRDWVIEYHAHVSPIPKEWPDIYIEGWSAHFGVNEVLTRPEWAERFFATAHKMGVRYMDANEPMDLALLMPPETRARWMDLANRYEIGTGWWIDFGSRYGWGMVAPYLQSDICKLSPEAEDYFQKTVDLVRTYKLRGLHWADFWAVWPCDDSGHGSLPGKYSIYAQGQRMVRFNQQMHEASPGLMVGADGGLNNPQYGRYADSRHHGGGDDAEPSVEPDIHLDRLYADMNRDYLYGLAHETFLRPWFRLLNCVNHFGWDTHHHDSAGYRYALLSAISQGAQLTFNDAPDDIPESDIHFTQYWEKWAADHADYLKENDKLFDRSALRVDGDRGGADWEGLAGYAHIRGDRGYLFFFNSGVVEQVAQLTLALDAASDTRFSVSEIYPAAVPLRGPADGDYKQGGILQVTVPAKQARIIWIAPAVAGERRADAQPEDARVAEWRRYVGDWTVEQGQGSAVLRANFQPPSDPSFYRDQTPGQDWEKEPWDYNKAYLVFLLKDEMVALHDNWIPDNLSFDVYVNGIAKTPHAFKTVRRQSKDATRCYFVALEGETKPGEKNEVKVIMPVRSGLVFSGAYLDLPDQTPLAP